MARRKPKTLRYRAGKLLSATSKAGRKRVKAAKKNVAKRIKVVSRRVNKSKKRAARFFKSNSLSKAVARRAKKANRQAKKTSKVLKRIGKRRLREARRRLKKLPGQTRKAKRFAKKRLRAASKNTTRFFKARKKAARLRGRERKIQARDQRRALRAQERARTQFDLDGTVDITGARVRTSNADPGASKPGEPPKMRTGKGRSAIKAQLRLKGKKLESRVYVDKKIAGYMAMWEFRKDGKGRPFLKPAVEDNKEAFGRVIGSELKQANKGGKKKAVVK
jgi:hypothetical protein